MAMAAGCRSAVSTMAAIKSTAGGEKRIIVLTNGNSPFWDACRVGIQEAEKDLGLKNVGLSAVLEVNDGTPQGQIDKLRQFASQSDIVAVGISPCDAANVAVAELMRQLKTKGVQVVTIDSDVDRDKLRDARFAFIGTDNLAGGRELGKCAKYLRPEGGEYVTFVGRTGAQNAIERVGGVRQGAGDKFKSLDNMGDDTDLTRARENVRNAIRNHPKLNTLVGIWSYNAPAIVDVVTEMKNRDKFTIVTFDAEPLAIKQMSEGAIDAMVVQNPYEMGYQGVRLLKALIENDQDTVKTMFPTQGKPEGDIYDTGIKVVVPDQGSPLKSEMFEKKTQFLKLSTFREWLEKYKLTGS
jgi:ribose transport system substrate-binding protein